MMMTTKMIMIMATKIIFMLQKKYDEKKRGKKGENRGEHLILVYKIVFVMLQKSFAGA